MKGCHALTCPQMFMQLLQVAPHWAWSKGERREQKPCLPEPQFWRGGGGDKLQGHLCAIRWEGDRVSGEGPRLTELASSLGVLKRSRLTWLKL